MFSRQPGNANNDIVGLALLLAAVAILVQGRPGQPLSVENCTTNPNRLRAASRPPLWLWQALQPVLALGTKLTFAVPVAALTVGVIVIAAGEQRDAQRLWPGPCRCWPAGASGTSAT